VVTKAVFEGRAAIVSGATGAIGSAVAAEFAAMGAQVACLDVVDPADVAEKLSKAGHEALAVQVDLTDEKAVGEAVAEVLQWAGKADVLVNMAGLYYGVPRVPFWEIDPGTWDAVINSNLRTAFLCARAVSAQMRAQQGGRIVNVSSNVSVFGMANFMHYVSAKAALVGMTRSMARELGPFGIAVNAVAPGLVRTPRGTEELSPEYWQTVIAGQCLRSPIEIADVVNAVTFLSSAQSRMVTGQTLLVNGGASMGPF
jgi:3-oxoacyl-[acyl-carrier protein] reductase